MRCFYRLLIVTVSFYGVGDTRAAEPAPNYAIQLDVVARGYDGKTCWVHPRAGAIPPASDAAGAAPSVVLTMQKLLLTGSDVFYALNDLRTDDLGKTWVGPTEHGDTLGRRSEPDPLDSSKQIIVAACDFTPKWHAKSGKLLGIGHTVRYRDEKVIKVRRRETAYAVYDAEQRTWSPWTTLEMPDDPKFFNCGAGCVQRVDLPSGDILLPVYFGPEGGRTRVAVLRCTFDGAKLRFVEQGNELFVDQDRGLHEPSLTKFGDRYFLTVRQDKSGYVTSGSDGLHFDELRPWQWDDGTELGNYNTQQHWVTHDDGLFLVYTRRGANNDHIIRHRAPLFIAQVDPATLRAIRKTERVLVPERGARLGNFGVCEVNENETWVTVAEWMQTFGPNHVIPPDNKYGADNSVYAARIRWETPNRSWNER